MASAQHYYVRQAELYEAKAAEETQENVKQAYLQLASRYRELVRRLEPVKAERSSKRGSA